MATEAKSRKRPDQSQRSRGSADSRSRSSGNLNKAAKRNLDRFPLDFMFQLTSDEAENLRFQIGISSSDFGGRRYLPYAFTEQTGRYQW
jgi:hypothetical protein